MATNARHVEMSDAEFFEKAIKEIFDAVTELRKEGYRVDYPTYIEITKTATVR